jgi:hypothetical protein
MLARSLGATGSLTVALLCAAPGAPGAQNAAALGGLVTSAEDGPMEGVLVSAKKRARPSASPW